MRRWQQRLDIAFAYPGMVGLADMDKLPIDVFEDLATNARRKLDENKRQQNTNPHAPRIR